MRTRAAHEDKGAEGWEWSNTRDIVEIIPSYVHTYQRPQFLEVTTKALAMDPCFHSWAEIVRDVMPDRDDSGPSTVWLKSIKRTRGGELDTAQHVGRCAAKEHDLPTMNWITSVCPRDIRLHSHVAKACVEFNFVDGLRLILEGGAVGPYGMGELLSNSLRNGHVDCARVFYALKPHWAVYGLVQSAASARDPVARAECTKLILEKEKMDMNDFYEVINQVSLHRDNIVVLKLLLQAAQRLPDQVGRSDVGSPGHLYQLRDDMVMWMRDSTFEISTVCSCVRVYQ